jgi:glycosyltransferase involved in cell wall biosynthesis
MRIGMMLRALDEKGGIGVYATNLVTELLRIDRKNHYVLFYRSAANMGRFASYDNVTESVVGGGHKAVWDQIAIPRACQRQNVDLIFHPKFTVPLMATCPTIMVVHGADWFLPEQARFYGKLDVAYIRRVMPLYFKKASVVISVSQLTTDNFIRALQLPPGKIETVYFGPATHFKPVTEKRVLEEVRVRYRLPETRFILTLTKRDGAERKNLPGLLRGYALYHDNSDHPLPLIIGGSDCEHLRSEYSVPEDGYGRDIHFTGWIDQQHLPAVYSLADIFLYPSNLEAFPIPITEAMTSGTPVITSRANGLEEIAGEAALLVDPARAKEIAEAIARLLDDEKLRRSLRERGLVRARRFTWDRCAQRTLEIIERFGPG